MNNNTPGPLVAYSAPGYAHPKGGMGQGSPEDVQSIIVEKTELARTLWEERQEECAKYGADIPKPSVTVRVDAFIELVERATRSNADPAGINAELLEAAKNALSVLKGVAVFVTSREQISKPNDLEAAILRAEQGGDDGGAADLASRIRPLIEPQWRDIADAPRDGTEVVFINKYGHCSDVVHWCEDYTHARYDVHIPGRWENRSGQSTGMNDKVAWSFWIRSPLPLPTPPEPKP